jgi:hypothetical protein
MMLRDNVTEVSDTAIRFAESLGKAAIEPLNTLLGATDVTARERAVQQLSKLRDPAVISPLLRAIRDSDPVIRQQALEALRERGLPVIEHLSREAASPDVNVRWKAVDAMQRLRDERSAEALAVALEDSEADIREMAASTLRSIGWQPQTPEERITLYWAQGGEWHLIGAFGAQAIPVMLRHIHEKDVRIRRYLDDMLSQICGQVKTVVFGEADQLSAEPSSIVYNIDAANLPYPLGKIQQIVIFPESAEFRLMERFLTYAVNRVGEKILKKQVSVRIVGRAERLHPNLLNNFTHLCKSVSAEQE